MSLKTLNVNQGDEVITAANTFVATIGAITELGAKPIFVDCDDTFCMQNVSSQSTKIGLAPSSVIAPIVATNVLAAVITSSP